MIISSGMVADFLRAKYFTTTVVRKLLSIVGFGMTALSLLGLAYVGCNKTLAIVLLVCATGIQLSIIYNRFTGSCFEVFMAVDRESRITKFLIFSKKQVFLFF